MIAALLSDPLAAEACGDTHLLLATGVIAIFLLEQGGERI